MSLLKFRKLTLTEWNALAVKDSNTRYTIYSDDGNSILDEYVGDKPIKAIPIRIRSVLEEYYQVITITKEMIENMGVDYTKIFKLFIVGGTYSSIISYDGRVNIEYKYLDGSDNEVVLQKEFYFTDEIVIGKSDFGFYVYYRDATSHDFVNISPGPFDNFINFKLRLLEPSYGQIIELVEQLP